MEIKGELNLVQDKITRLHLKPLATAKLKVMESVTHNQKSAEADDIAATILTRHDEQLSDIIQEIRNINTSHQPSSHSSILSQLLHDVDHSPGESPIELLLEEQKRETRLILGFAIIVIPIVVACMNRML